MKKIVAILLTLLLCLNLCACRIGIPNTDAPTTPRKESVVAVEQQIAQLGTITPKSFDALCAAQNAYDALSEQDRCEVSTYQQLENAWDTYYTQVLSGDWCNYNISSFVDAYEVERLKNTVLTLREDGTFTYTTERRSLKKIYGVPISLGLEEGDVNAEALVTMMYNGIYTTLGFNAVPLQTPEDGKLFLKLISEAKPIVKRPAPEKA
jgi:hypothetical protein